MASSLLNMWYREMTHSKIVCLLPFTGKKNVFVFYTFDYTYDIYI